MPIKKGNRVKVEYTGTLDDGTVFDSSEKLGAPLEFEIGAGQVIKGFEDAIVGMKKGEEKEIKLKPSEAYGDYDPLLTKEVGKDKIPGNGEFKVGTVLLVSLPDGTQVPAQVSEVKDKSIIIDLNHPLAGKLLIFRVRVVDVS